MHVLLPEIARIGGPLAVICGLIGGGINLYTHQGEGMEPFVTGAVIGGLAAVLLTAVYMGAL